MAAIVFRIISVAVFATVMVSCGGRSEFVGAWRGERDVKPRPGEDPAMLRTYSRLDLTIEADGRFQMVDAGMPKAGAVRYEGKDAFLRVETILERPLTPGVAEMNEEILLLPQPDGSLLLTDPKGFDAKPIRLRRKTAP